ncbi:MAG: gliding motility-associated C-terminal domain-containing protein [Flavobacteriales bacterium]|nr:gliding motility-associated C-terminal domain-containing protein [Flavobacteriales bacterium]
MSIQRYITLSYFICTSAWCFAQSGMQARLQCVSVDPVGSVTITWQMPEDTCSDFIRYELYRSTQATGPFNLVYQVNNDPTVLSYPDNGINAQLQPYYYFVRAVSACGTFDSDTLGNLTVQVTGNGGGIATVNWSLWTNPPAGTSSLVYIYREYPAGTWTLLDSTTTAPFVDTISICNSQINYRIMVANDSGCTSVSSVDGDVFQDVIAPGITELDSLSVDTSNGNAHMGWQPSPDPDAAGYIIYQWVGGFWQPVDTLWGKNNTYFNNPGGGAGANFEQYRVAAFDSCFNVSPLGTQHNTIFLDVSIDRCTLESSLTWNEYKGWNDGVSSYTIYAIENGGTPVALDSVQGTSYIHTGLNGYSVYCYVVRANDGSGLRTSSSNKVCVYSDPPFPPAYTYVSTATVNGSAIDVTFYVDTMAEAMQYLVQRAPIASGPYATIATLTPGGSPLVTYTDNSVDPAAGPYAYRLEVINTCGASAMISSNVGQTMVCTATANNDFTNTITWTAYTDWPAGISEYRIYRTVGGVGIKAMIATVGSSQFTYIDPVDQLTSGDGSFCYEVEAVENAGNPWPFSVSSVSNEACAYQLPRLYIPNAFTPDDNGLNDEFIPISMFIDPLEYQFIVFNRWSDVVFETVDPMMGWDGTFNGHNQPLGVYVYFVKIKTVDGRTFDKKGTFNLIR